jgi:hypothetical protein
MDLHIYKIVIVIDYRRRHRKEVTIYKAIEVYFFSRHLNRKTDRQMHRQADQPINRRTD